MKVTSEHGVPRWIQREGNGFMPGWKGGKLGCMAWFGCEHVTGRACTRCLCEQNVYYVNLGCVPCLHPHALELYVHVHWFPAAFNSYYDVAQFILQCLHPEAPLSDGVSY